MLLSVCLNPAVDVTYRLDSSVVPGKSHRVKEVREQAGGKGINVARVLQQLDVPVMILAPVGGATGARIRSELTLASLPARLVEIAEPTRRTLAVVDPDDATVFNEPGPMLGPVEWKSLLEEYQSLLNDATLVVLSGSLPPGIPPEGYRILAELAGARGRPSIVDAEGAPLRLALDAKPYLVKPNLAELETIVGGRLSSTSEILAAGLEVRRLGARNVVISCGADGLVAVTEEGNWRAVSPEVVRGNPTGAGDALVAALAAGTGRDQPWPGKLRDGVSVSAAAVASPVAGRVEATAWARLLRGVVIEELKESRH